MRKAVGRRLKCKAEMVVGRVKSLVYLRATDRASEQLCHVARRRHVADDNFASRREPGVKQLVEWRGVGAWASSRTILVQLFSVVMSCIKNACLLIRTISTKVSAIL